MPKAYKINPRDNVAVCLDGVEAGNIVKVSDGSQITAKDDIPVGHKIALRDIEVGEYIIKFGEVIGIAVKRIAEGEHVHIHNIKSTRLGRR